MPIRKITKEDVIIEIIPSLEHIPVRGNLVVSGDDEYDKQEEDKVLARLEHDIWAWCCVEVKIKFLCLEASEYLGGCTYDDGENFKTSGYCEDMVDRALEEMNKQIEAVFKELEVENESSIQK